jgi:hypothetical protein
MTLNFSGYAIEAPLLSFVIVCLFAAPTLISVFAIVRIVQRAGYSGWWVLIIFVPIANMLALWYFAFGPWPAHMTPGRAK